MQSNRSVSAATRGTSPAFRDTFTAIHAQPASERTPVTMSLYARIHGETPPAVAPTPAPKPTVSPWVERALRGALPAKEVRVG